MHLTLTPADLSVLDPIWKDVLAEVDMAYRDYFARLALDDEPSAKTFAGLLARSIEALRLARSVPFLAAPDDLFDAFPFDWARLSPVGPQGLPGDDERGFDAKSALDILAIGWKDDLKELHRRYGADVILYGMAPLVPVELPLQADDDLAGHVSIPTKEDHIYLYFDGSPHPQAKEDSPIRNISDKEFAKILEAAMDENSAICAFNNLRTAIARGLQDKNPELFADDLTTDGVWRRFLAVRNELRDDHLRWLDAPVPLTGWKEKPKTYRTALSILEEAIERHEDPLTICHERLIDETMLYADPANPDVLAGFRLDEDAMRIANDDCETAVSNLFDAFDLLNDWDLASDTLFMVRIHSLLSLLEDDDKALGDVHRLPERLDKHLDWREYDCKAVFAYFATRGGAKRAENILTKAREKAKRKYEETQLELQDY